MNDPIIKAIQKKSKEQEEQLEKGLRDKGLYSYHPKTQSEVEVMSKYHNQIEDIHFKCTMDVLRYLQLNNTDTTTPHILR